jgi:hypothetical protein
VPVRATEVLPYMYPCEYGSGIVFTVLAGSAVRRKRKGPNSRSCIARASGLPSSRSTIRPSSA